MTRPVERRTWSALAAALVVLAGSAWLAPLRAQEVDPNVEASYDTPEMRRILDEARRLPVEDHAALVMRLRTALDERLLTPDPAVAARWAELQGAPDAGVARLLTRGLFENQTRVRGGGAYFSFVTRSNDYDEGPDLCLEQGRFSSGFYGSCLGVVTRLDARDVRSVTEAGLPAHLTGTWEAVKEYSDSTVLERMKAHTYHPEVEEGGVYAVRSVRFEAADTLTVLQVIGVDRHGITIAWRRLHRYETPTTKR